MNSKLNTKAIIISALLCAIGIIVPLFSPIKIILEPASYTLASHVAIFIAMFISPSTAIFVALGTTLGFFLGGFPIVVVFRALSHVIFASIGSFLLKNNKEKIKNIKSSLGFSLTIGLIHGICEVLIVMPFYFGQSLSVGYYDKGFLGAIVGLVGIGTIIHSMLDFGLSVYIWNILPNEITRNIVRTQKA